MYSTDIWKVDSGEVEFTTTYIIQNNIEDTNWNCSESEKLRKLLEEQK